MRKPLKHNLENDALYQRLVCGVASSDEQRDAAAWIRGLYENPDHYDRALNPTGEAMPGSTTLWEGRE